MTLIWAHRGASKYYPENTQIAFEKAEEAGADGIELDVHLSKDGHVVICHDESIDRTSNGEGLIKDYDLADLQEFNFAALFDQVDEQRILTLDELLAWAKDTDLKINIELKTNIFDYEGIEEKCVQMINEYGLGERVLFSSFNHYSILRILEQAPEMDTAFLTASTILEPGDYCKRYGVNTFHPLYRTFRPQDLKSCQEAKVAVNSWTVDDATIMKKLALAGVGLITNDPTLAKETI